MLLIHHKDIAAFKEAMDGHLRHNQNFDLLIRLKSEEKDFIWTQMNGQATWNDKGHPYRMVGSINDVTEKVEFQNALKESESSFKYLQTVSTTENLSLSDKINSLIHFCNKRFQTDYAVFGYWKNGTIIVENAITPDSKILPGDRYPASNSFATPVHESQESLQIKDLRETDWKELEFIKELGITTYLGTPVFAEKKSYGAICFFNPSTTEPIEYSKREITFLNIVATWIGMEITRQQYQKKLKEEKIKADQANRAKTEFLQNMSHEIRTPMNGIMGMVYLLMDTDINEKQKKYADGLINSAEHLLSIIEDILDISRIEAGKITFNRSSFNLKRLVKSVVKQVSASIKNKDINVLLRFDPKAPEFFIEDKDRIQQIVENLSTNAVKFTHSGYIYVNVELIDEKQDEASVKISIEDTGVGISEDKQKLVFEKFQQVDSSSSRKYGGMGIGLAICKNLVKLMGGEIGVKSRPDIGSTFWITLTLKKNLEKTKKRSFPDHIKGKKAFILTDNKIFQQIICESFTDAGIECRSSNILGDSLEEPEIPDVFIIDELALDEEVEKDLRKLQSEQSMKDVPFILIEHSYTETPSRSMSGWRAILTKPLLADQLLREVVSVLGASGGRGGSIAEEKKEKAAPETTESPHILVVEDDPVNQRVIHDLLEIWGCRITLADNGKEAVDKVKQFNYDLIFMDCVMPRMDGYQATRTIREVEKERNIDKTPIVALTARVGKGEDTKCYESGMDDYLTKPVNKDAVQKTLKKWIDKH